MMRSLSLACILLFGVATFVQADQGNPHNLLHYSGFLLCVYFERQVQRANTNKAGDDESGSDYQQYGGYRS